MGLLMADTAASQGLCLSGCKGAEGACTPVGWILWGQKQWWGVVRRLGGLR